MLVWFGRILALLENRKRTKFVEYNPAIYSPTTDGLGGANLFAYCGGVLISWCFSWLRLPQMGSVSANPEPVQVQVPRAHRLIRLWSTAAPGTTRLILLGHFYYFRLIERDTGSRVSVRFGEMGVFGKREVPVLFMAPAQKVHLK